MLEISRQIAEIMDFKNCLVDAKEAAILDYYSSGILWGKENDFSVDQLSALFTVLHFVLDNLKGKQIERKLRIRRTWANLEMLFIIFLLEKHLPIVENLSFLKKLFAGIGMENCELSGGLECFDIKQAKLISDYMNDT